MECNSMSFSAYEGCFGESTRQSKVVVKDQLLTTQRKYDSQTSSGKWQICTKMKWMNVIYILHKHTFGKL